MYLKKYGRITFSAWLNLELGKSSLALTVVCGVLASALCVAVGCLTEQPYRVILELGIGDLVPPVWLFALFRFLAMFTAGCGIGLVLGRREPSCAAEKYRTGMLFLLMAAAELCWFPMLFGACRVFLSVLDIVLAVILAVYVTVGSFRVSGLSGGIFVLHAVWLIYLLIMSISVLLRC
ncbi:MAG: hypothetical protein E7620_03060 [Ruminococcaceae bacterium]|nr:hypothetical protein [Oscillospiraceae bacterium]